ncbi:MAG: DsbA family protein [Actinomycetota bacterium]|nr:DsbA family protein [Actinomycetota bacterium]
MTRTNPGRSKPFQSRHRPNGVSDYRRVGQNPRQKAHWEATADLDRLADLQRIVAGAGLDPADQQRGLDEGRYEALLDRYREEAMAMGINAIPAHVVGQRYLLLGAQPYEAFIEVLDKLQAGESATGEAGTT